MAKFLYINSMYKDFVYKYR